MERLTQLGLQVYTITFSYTEISFVDILVWETDLTTVLSLLNDAGIMIKFRQVLMFILSFKEWHLEDVKVKRIQWQMKWSNNGVMINIVSIIIAYQFYLLQQQISFAIMIARNVELLAFGIMGEVYADITEST